MSGHYIVKCCHEVASKARPSLTHNLSLIVLQILKETVIVETNNGDVFKGRFCSDYLQLMSKKLSCMLILMRSGCGLRGGFFGFCSHQLLAIIDLVLVNRRTLGLQGLRSPTLFLDCVSGAVSTCMANQLSCSQHLPSILRKEGMDIVMSPLFRNGLQMEYKKRIAADILSADYHMAEIVPICVDQSAPEVSNRTVKAIMKSTMDTTILACGLQLEMDLDTLKPTSSSITISSIDNSVTSEANPIDEAMFKVIKMPRLLSSRNPNHATIYSFYHLFLLLLSYHSNTPITSETSSCQINNEISFIVIMEPLYAHANHLLQWLNDRRVRSEKSWDDLSAMKDGLAKLLLYVEPSGMSPEAVSCVQNGND